MQFNIRLQDLNTPWASGRIRSYAKKIILLHEIKPSEVKLNKYLEKNFQLNLITASLLLLNNCTIYKNLAGTITVLFNNKQDDDLAALITYGNLEAPGSSILKEAFLRKD